MLVSLLVLSCQLAVFHRAQQVRLVDLLEVGEDAVVLAVDDQPGIVGAARPHARVAHEHQAETVAQQVPVVRGRIEGQALEAKEVTIGVLRVEPNLELHLVFGQRIPVGRVAAQPNRRIVDDDVVVFELDERVVGLGLDARVLVGLAVVPLPLELLPQRLVDRDLERGQVVLSVDGVAALFVRRRNVLVGVRPGVTHVGLHGLG